MKILLHHFNKSKISVSTVEVDERAREILTHHGMPLNEYLRQRLINQVDFVNEISLLLFSEKFTRQEIVKMGAVKVAITRYDSKEEASNRGASSDTSADWYAPFMIVGVPELKQALFEGETAKMVVGRQNKEKIYFGLRVEDRIKATPKKAENFQVNLKKLEKWVPNTETIALFLDFLAKKQGLEFFPEKIYDNYGNQKRN